MKSARSAPFTLAAALPALALVGCAVDPTPSMMAHCRGDAVAEARPGPKSASLFIDSAHIPRPCFACNDLLRGWRLDFVEFRSGSADGRVDRVRLRPRGDPACAPTGDRDRQPRPPLPIYLSVPRQSCLAVEHAQEPAAAARLTISVAPAGDHHVELYEAGPLGGPARIRVRDFVIRAPDARAAQCSRVVRGFPGDAMRFVLDRVAERR